MFSRSASIYDAVYSFKDYTAEAELLHTLIEERVPGATSLLDVACGTGKHLEQLRRWYDVEGVDLDESLLEVARDRLDGIPLQVADMTSLSLGRRFDVVTCLFSSIGYAGTPARLNAAVAAMASHVRPGGLLVVEPWLTPELWQAGRPHLLAVDEPDLKIARLNVSGREGRLAIMEFVYLVATPDGVSHFSERHEAALFTDDEYRQAFSAANLAVRARRDRPDRARPLPRPARLISTDYPPSEG
jgi:SAM-dependent methyltransferase